MIAAVHGKRNDASVVGARARPGRVCGIFFLFRGSWIPDSSQAERIPPLVSLSSDLTFVLREAISLLRCFWSHKGGVLTTLPFQRLENKKFRI